MTHSFRGKTHWRAAEEGRKRERGTFQGGNKQIFYAVYDNMGVGRRRRGWTRRILRRGEVGGVRKAALFLSPFKLVCADIVNMTLLSPSSLLSIPRDNEEEEEEEEGRASISSSRRRRRRRQMRVGECTHSWSEEGGLDFSLVGRKPHTLAVAQIRKGSLHSSSPSRSSPPSLFYSSWL